MNVLRGLFNKGAKGPNVLIPLRNDEGINLPAHVCPIVDICQLAANQAAKPKSSVFNNGFEDGTLRLESLTCQSPHFRFLMQRGSRRLWTVHDVR